MQYVGKVLSSVSDFYRELNPATLSGAVDIIVVKDEQGNLSCSPFHVRFGKFQLLRPSDKTVEITVNDKKADFYMKLGEAGEAFFVLETDNDVPSDIMTSPIHSPTLYSPELEPIESLNLPESDDLSQNEIQDAPIQSKESELFQKEKNDLSSYSIMKSIRNSSSIENISLAFHDDSQINRKKYSHRRPLSVSSDSKYELSSLNDALDLDGAEKKDELHHEWDWGVSIPSHKNADHIVNKNKNSSPVEPLSTSSVSNSCPNINDLVVTNDVISALSSTDMTRLEISFCGADSIIKASNKDERLANFKSKQVKEFDSSYNIFDNLTNKDAVFLLNGNYYLWKDISSAFFSILILGKVEKSFSISPIAIDNFGSEADNFNLHSKSLSSNSEILGSTSNSNQTNYSSAELASFPNVDQSSINNIIESSSPGSKSKWRWWRSSTISESVKNTPDIQFNKSSTFNPETDSLISTSDNFSIADSQSKSNQSTSAENHKFFAKTLRLTHEQLESLDLKFGENKVLFRVKSGKGYCEARIFMYPHDVQIVISDIDGTITKSDALGHIFNMVGRDWTHTGVAKLFTEIHKNQYEFLYLTSRAIGQADTTREYLKNVKQGSNRLPSGPLLLSPDRLFASFHREIIMRRPQEFKMACLRDIKNLFNNDTPFYAGFGNRITDAMSYRSVNVPVSRICTIDPTGDVRLELLSAYKSSYTKMGDLVDLMFPPLKTKIDPHFNDFEYWRSSLPDIEDELSQIDIKDDASIKQKSSTSASQDVFSTSPISISKDTKVRRAYSAYSNDEYLEYKKHNQASKNFSITNIERNLGPEFEEFNHKRSSSIISPTEANGDSIYNKKISHFNISENILESPTTNTAFSAIARKKSKESFTYLSQESTIPQHKFENLFSSGVDIGLLEDITVSQDNILSSSIKSEDNLVEDNSPTKPFSKKNRVATWVQNGVINNKQSQTSKSSQNELSEELDSNETQKNHTKSLHAKSNSNQINEKINEESFESAKSKFMHKDTTSSFDLEEGDGIAVSKKFESNINSSVDDIISKDANNDYEKSGLEFTPTPNTEIDNYIYRHGQQPGIYEISEHGLNDVDDEEIDDEDAMSSLSGEIDLNDFPYL
ncbi:Nuclear elongation and deformation protein 1 [Smittium culicis]|uniref:Nuclear elongation and deformation protein 1 n=1 Tax=Smittium culicis TaxID=133412 RepID=A0A1R1Y1L9_9FUNG|nr:Nuclear elongation and deformation protein 1 [Smittium culicis]